MSVSLYSHQLKFQPVFALIVDTHCQHRLRNELLLYSHYGFVTEAVDQDFFIQSCYCTLFNVAVMRNIATDRILLEI